MSFDRRALTRGSRRRGASLLTAVLAMLLMGGCATPPERSAVSRFAVALDVTAGGVARSFEEVEALAQRTDRESRAVEFVMTGRPDLTGRPRVLAPEVVEPRLLVLQGLAAYAQLLVALTGDEAARAVDASFGQLGQQLLSLNATFGTLSGRPTIPEQTASLGVQGIRAIGQFLVASQVRRTVPGVVEQMHPHVKAVADLLIADIGEPERSVSGQTEPGKGLRGLLSNSRNQYVRARQLALAAIADDQRVDRGARHASFLQTLDDMDSLQDTDGALAMVQESLRQMVAAHAKLRSPEDPSAIEQARAFFAYAESIGRLFSRSAN